MRALALVIALALAAPLAGDYRSYPPDLGDTKAKKKGRTRPIGVTPGPPPKSCKKCWDYDQFLLDLQCGGTINPTCSLPGPGGYNYMILACDPGGMPPPTIMLLYQVGDPTAGDCQAQGQISGFHESTGLNTKQQQDCYDSLVAYGYCP